MAALLKGGFRHGTRLREGLSLHMGCDACSKLSPHEKTATSLLHTGFINLSSEATSNVHAIGNRASVGFVFKPSGYKRSIIENGFGAMGRWTGWRPFSSLQAFPSSIWDVSSSIDSSEFESSSIDSTEFESENVEDFDFRNNSAFTSSFSIESTEFESENVEDFDFRNFPALTSSFFENYERPSEMQVRKKRGVWKSLVHVDKKLTLDSIPKPRGRTYDFGLGDVAAKPPPLEAGARPQGGFDIDISFNECEVDALLQKQSPLGNLPSKIEERDKWPEISKRSCIAEDRELQMTEDRDFQVIKDLEFQTSEDKVLDHEQDLLWDPYNVDEA